MATYWVEVSRPLAEQSWFKDKLAVASLEFLEAGPSTEHTTFWKVRDAGAPEDLAGKTVELTLHYEVIDPNASPPVYTYKITERKERTYS